jgi:tripeptidyl-peptidase-1
LAYGETGDSPNQGDPVYPDVSYGGKPMCGKFTPTNVITISYGGDEWDVPAFYQQRQCNE